MDNQPSIDRGVLIPILVGGLSVIGIITVLLIGRLTSSRATVEVVPTETRFEYIFLGTEPAPSTPLAEEPEIPRPTNAPTVISTPPTLSLTQPNFTNTAIGIILSSPTITRATTSPGTPASVSNTYDDTDSRLVYSGSWVAQSNVSGAYQSTLHVSSAIGDSVSFTFTGQQIRFFYQAGPSLGSVTITLDALGSPALDQSQSQTQFKEWVSGLLAQGTHTVVIAHSAGGSVNVDSVIVPPSSTGTPATAAASTSTPTLTPTQ